MSSDKNRGVLMQLNGFYAAYVQDSKTVTAVEDINLTILPGEYVAISGIFGRAKGTFLSNLGCNTKALAGKYLLDYEDVSLMSNDELNRLRNEKVGYVLNAADLIPNAAIAEHLALPLQYATFSKVDVDSMINHTATLLGLQDIQRKLIAELDKLQKQKVCLAMAMIKNPLVLVMDEPTEGLDANDSSLLLEILNQLNKLGNTIVMFTNNPDTAKAAKRRILFHDGKVFADQSIS